MNLEFDKSYSALFSNREVEGIRSYLDNEKSIVLKSDKGESKIKVISITAKNLILKPKNDPKIIYEKSSWNSIAANTNCVKTKKKNF